MQINTKEIEINRFEFFWELKNIISDIFGSKIYYYDSEFSFLTNDKEHKSVMKKNEGILTVTVNKNELKYQITLNGKETKEYIYCTFEQVKKENNFKKCKWQLKEDLNRLVDNFNRHDSFEEDFLYINEFKYSEDYEIPEINKSFWS